MILRVFWEFTFYIDEKINAQDLVKWNEQRKGSESVFNSFLRENNLNHAYMMLEFQLAVEKDFRNALDSSLKSSL